MKDFIEDIVEEGKDFFEDLWEHITEDRPSIPSKMKTIRLRGVQVKVRPAYVFAERIENILKIIFAVSVLVSAVTSSLWGFASLSQLVEALVTTFSGKVIMILIGTSYLLVALWKLMQLSSNSEKSK